MKSISRVFAAALFLNIFAVQAAVKTETVSYKDGDVELQGQIVYDDSISGKRPGVIVVHEWWGLDDHAQQRAAMLAREGYVAFAVDMYGKNKVTRHAEQAKAWMTQITSNIDAWRKRALLGVDLLKQHPQVSGDKIAAIGYCFGGATVMHMAYAGVDLKGVASFHGSLPPASPDQAKKIKAAVYVAHGEADAFVPTERVSRFKAALEQTGVNLQFMSFPGVRHSFTNPNAGEFGMDNLAYDANADKMSWAQLQEFFAKIFTP